MPYHGTGFGVKGGGAPTRYNGRGPAPARHIPWPEIFKHHISLIEGHLKMVEMVRKHTVEGTGNHRTIMGCVNRCREMLRDIKDISRSFAPPPGQREQVPLGVSSDSMYPGYSLKDHEYGKAAEEYGKAAAEARAKGMDVKHPDVEYEFGQAKGIKRPTLAKIREAKAARESGSGSGTGSGSDGPTGPAAAKMATTSEKPRAAMVKEAAPEGDNPYFVIDTKPTPVHLPDMFNPPTKRGPPSPQEASNGSMQKKHKKKHSGDLPKPDAANGVEFEDISEEVDARMKEKEEKRKRKEEKKRKRESGSDHATSSVAAPEANDASVEDPKPKKKKKSKYAKDEALADRTKKRPTENEGISEDEEGRKKKTRKKHKEKAEEA